MLALHLLGLLDEVLMDVPQKDDTRLATHIGRADAMLDAVGRVTWRECVGVR